MIVDASVATHWFVWTPFSGSARRIMERGNLAAPALIEVELVSSLLKYLRVGALSIGDLTSASVGLGRVIGQFVADRLLLDTAIDISVAHGHKIYDCLYLALALQNRSLLATADRRMASLAAELGITVEFVEPEA